MESSKKITNLCPHCACSAVCSIYRAVGEVERCKHFIDGRTGHWILRWHIDPNGDYKLLHCSRCDAPSARRKRFCYDCGIKMEIED